MSAACSPSIRRVDVLLALRRRAARAPARGRAARRRHPPHPGPASSARYAAASGALAWGAAAGWDAAAFRVYYLCGGLLTAPLLGAGSLLLSGRRWAAPLALVWTGLAVGIALAMPIHGDVRGRRSPRRRSTSRFPARGRDRRQRLGTLAVVGVAAATIRRRPVGNALIVAGVAVAALGCALAGLGVARTAASFAIAVALLYAGFVAPPARAREATPRGDGVLDARG